MAALSRGDGSGPEGARAIPLRNRPERTAEAAPLPGNPAHAAPAGVQATSSTEAPIPMRRRIGRRCRGRGDVERPSPAHAPTNSPAAGTKAASWANHTRPRERSGWSPGTSAIGIVKP